MSRNSLPVVVSAIAMAIIIFGGALSAPALASWWGTNPTFNSSLQVGATGTPILNDLEYGIQATPAAIPTASSVEVDLTATGVTASDTVTVNAPGLTQGIVFGGARVVSANTVGLLIGNLTAGSLTPPAGTYRVLAIRN